MVEMLFAFISLEFSCHLRHAAYLPGVCLFSISTGLVDFATTVLSPIWRKYFALQVPLNGFKEGGPGAIYHP